MNMIQPGTGLIVAMAQSRPKMGNDKKKGETFWNLSVEPSMGGIQGYQAGSTFKAFTAAAALEKGIPLSKKYNAKHSMDLGGRGFSSCEGRDKIYGKWKVTNSTTSGDKVIDMYEAAQKSVNTYFAQLVLDVGMCSTTKMAEKLGVKLGTRNRGLVDYYQHIPAFTLGSVEVSPLSMAEAYATFAARGIHCDPTIIDEVKDRNGKKLDIRKGNCQRVMSEDVADGMNKLLASVVTKGTGARARTADGRPQAGKTGTINSNEAVWYVGYTPEIAGAAMISIDNTRKPFMRKKDGFRRNGVKGYQVPSTNFNLEGSGSGDAGQDIWKPTMEKYLSGIPKTGFKAPPTKIERGKMVDIPSIFGLGLRAGTKKLEKAGFSVVTTSVYSRLPEGTFLGFSPSPGGRAPQFSTIFARYSKGRDPEVVAAERRAERAEERAEKRAAEKKKKAEEKKKKAEEKKGDG
jgi:membrane peptidoglycan carboxypeptidase